MVVPDNIAGDRITVFPGTTGTDCEKKLKIRFSSSVREGPSSFNFLVQGPWVSGTVLHSLPKVTLVAAELCGTTTRSVRIEAYPLEERSLTINLKELKKKVVDAFSKGGVELSNEGGDKFSKEARKKWNLEEAAAAVQLSYTEKWEEDKGSHLAYCKVELSGAISPLFGVEGTFPIYGYDTPALIKKYLDLKAGIFVTVDVALEVRASFHKRYWPHDQSTRWGAIDGRVKGGVSLALSAEALVANPNVFQVKASGKLEVGAEGKGEKASGENFKLSFQIDFKPLSATVQFRLFNGLVDFERAWQLSKSFTPLLLEREFK